MMVIKQYFDIKYPFTNDCIEKYEFDLNKSEKEKVASELLHLIFTPKGQRLRLPNYGTDLIKYIFEPNDSDAWKAIKGEISSQDYISQFRAVWEKNGGTALEEEAQKLNSEIDSIVKEVSAY